MENEENITKKSKNEYYRKKYITDTPKMPISLMMNDTFEIPSNEPNISQNVHCDSFTDFNYAVEEREISRILPDTDYYKFSFENVENLLGKSLNLNNKKYIILKEIAKGGFSVVYSALNEQMESVAVKHMKLNNFDEIRIRKSFEEIEFLKILRHSKHVINLIDYYVNDTGKEIYIILEKGYADLEQILLKDYSINGGCFKYNSNGKPIGIRRRRPNEVLNSTFRHWIWYQMVLCVHSIHEFGIIHGDIKPSNFIMCGYTLKLIDFGLSFTMEDDNPTGCHNNECGTLAYMSPESIQSANPEFVRRHSDDSKNTSLYNKSTSENDTRIGAYSDIWSLGIILYRITYGCTPFDHLGNEYVIIAKTIINKSKPIIFDKINNLKLMSLIQSCLDRSTHNRPTSTQLMNHSYMECPNSHSETGI
ncbi:hypothetical protein A3Q56_01536 [Intoshia linei]|uniref:Protein kinase domain-containing protein n=1 Tax=Intoshia linei TaxID=1819745 RepID=A0A177B8R1_9BILA|nr:hypothetical protein A3Q56_01536 [Intoshia linei]